MDPIQIPYHLAIPTLVCMFGLALMFRFRNRISFSTQPIWVSITFFLVIYLLIVGSALYTDLYCQWDLNRYDLDQDGFFGGPEQTPAQEAAMSRLTHDTGRNLSFITGFIAAFLIAVAVYVIDRILPKKGSSKSKA